jgi:hypothetical protein
VVGKCRLLSGNWEDVINRIVDRCTLGSANSEVIGNRVVSMCRLGSDNLDVVGNSVVSRCRLGLGSCISCCAVAGVSAIPVWPLVVGAGARGAWAEKTGPEKKLRPRGELGWERVTGEETLCKYGSGGLCLLPIRTSRHIVEGGAS